MPTATKPLTLDALQSIATHVANRGFTVSVEPHRVGFALEVSGTRYADADLAWLSRSLRENHGLAARKCGSLVIVTVAKPDTDTDHSVCTECEGDTADKIVDFADFATCRCCTGCGAPDTACVDIHATTDDPSDVEPGCLTCALEAESIMLANGWAPESFDLRPLPPSARMLRLAVLTGTVDRMRRRGHHSPESIRTFGGKALAALVAA